MRTNIFNAPFEMKSLDEESNVFEGYASVFRNVDNVGDVVEPGAFTKTIQENGDKIKVLWQHDPYTPIGKALKLEEDNHGLYVKAKIFDTTAGRDAMTLIKGGVIDVLSIGYRVIKDSWDKDNMVRRLKEVKLFEFSPVTFAANEMAAITGAKNDELSRTLYELNNTLKNGQVNTRDETAILNAIEALKALLPNNPPSANNDPGEAEKGQKSAEHKEIEADVKAMLQDMRNFVVK